MANKRFSRLVQIITGRRGAEDEDVFSLESGLSSLEKFAHFWVLVVRSFVRNRCPVRASALSYTTLLALVPMLAVAMSVTSLFLKSEGQEQIEVFIQNFVDRMVPSVESDTNAPAGESESPSTAERDFTDVTTTNGPETVMSVDVTNAPAATPTTNAPISDARVTVAQKKAAGYIHDFIQNTYSGTLGATGVVFLLATAILMLARVEETFNDIWGVTRGRTWLSRVVLYWSTITLVPLLMAAALGLSSGPRFQKTRELLTVVPFLEPLVSGLLPIAVVCVTFAMFYRLVPNTKVHFTAALVGGTLAGTGWHFINLISLRLASGAVNASKIYGSLALIPLFMAGLYLIWLTVLFGAQVAYAFQNRESYLQEKLVENVNQRGREFVALRLMTCVSQRFQRGMAPASIQEMSRELGIPSKLVQQVLRTLLAARLVIEVSSGEARYAPARPLESINAHHVLMAMRATVGQELITRDEPVRAEVLGEFARIQEAEKAVASGVSMLALVNRAQARLELVEHDQTQDENRRVTALTPPADSIPDDKTNVAPVVESDEPKPSPSPPPAAKLPKSEVAETQSSGTRPDASPDVPVARSSSGDNESFPL
jgi:membrane protein